MYFNKDNIAEIANVTADELEYAVNSLKAENGLQELGVCFIEAEEKYNINAIVLTAIACLESAYGTSKLATEKNNLFGLGANDEYKGDANKYGGYFSTKEDCVDYAAKKLRRQYLEEDPAAKWCYCGGATDIYAIGNIWCSNPEWADCIVDLSCRLSKAIDEERDSHIDWKSKCLRAEEKLNKIRDIVNDIDVASYSFDNEVEEAPSYE